MKKNKKQFPYLATDKEAEDFVDTADLSEYDFSDFKKAHFEFAPKSKSVSLRLSDSLYNATKQTATSRGMKTQQFMRQALENAIAA